MIRPNLGLLFYRTCYAKGEDTVQIKNTIERILNANDKDEAVETPFQFETTTLYPGLLIGSGYTHGISAEEDVKIGFFFDHTSGLPVIPGSSVKGVLRSLFGLGINGKTDPHKEVKEAMIRDLLGKESLDIKALSKAIFEGIKPEKMRKDPDDKLFGPYERDIFYDARIVRTSGRLMADDYITPHKNPLEDPIPIRFLKVAPGVTFSFSFRLHDTQIGETTVTAAEKLALFHWLIEHFGVGAKTNVGYGNFSLSGDDEFKTYLQKAQGRIRMAREREEQARKEAAEKAQKAQKLANMSPFEREVETLRNQLQPNEKFSTLLLKKIKEGHFEENRCEALKYLKKVMEEEKAWKPTSTAKKPEKDKTHQRTLEVVNMLKRCK
jgi:CRISPR-associated protein Cmr6